MATAMQSLRHASSRCAGRSACHTYIRRTSLKNQPFSSSAILGVDDATSKTFAKGSLEVEELVATVRSEAKNFLRSQPKRSGGLNHRPRATVLKKGFMAMGEKADRAVEDPQFEMDDISSIAHTELEQHREFREYARIAAWEMPLLTKMAKPFVPPTEKQVLRFRYTTYMGEEHPAEKKVVVEFAPADMPDLTPVQREKLKKLAGVRYNPETDIVKMSCEMFESQAQNKRYLGDLVDTLLKEARDPKDDFADVPLDTRHHTFKSKPKFPVEWRLTEQRQKELEAARQQAQLANQERALQGAIVDGVQQIKEALSKKSVPAVAAPVSEFVTTIKGKAKVKGAKKVTVRR